MVNSGKFSNYNIRFKCSQVSGGFGEYLLRKMGWSEGDGLGKNR